MSRRKNRLEAVHFLYQYDLLELGSKENKNINNALCEGVIENIIEIDKIIEDSLESYSLYRLSYIDRAIIRLATYEMKYTDTAHQIIINEAIEITKELSDIDDKQFKFNNRVLDNIKKKV